MLTGDHRCVQAAVYSEHQLAIPPSLSESVCVTLTGHPPREAGGERYETGLSLFVEPWITGIGSQVEVRVHRTTVFQGDKFGVVGFSLLGVEVQFRLVSVGKGSGELATLPETLEVRALVDWSFRVFFQSFGVVGFSLLGFSVQFRLDSVRESVRRAGQACSRTSSSM